MMKLNLGEITAESTKNNVSSLMIKKPTKIWLVCTLTKLLSSINFLLLTYLNMCKRKLIPFTINTKTLNIENLIKLPKLTVVFLKSKLLQLFNKSINELQLW